MTIDYVHGGNEQKKTMR